VALSWQPSPRRRLLYLLGAVVLALFAVLGQDGPFGLGTGLALSVVAAVLFGSAALDVWIGVPLEADEQGLSLSRGGGRREQLPWSAIERIEATSTTHRGLLLLSSLEIDLGDRLILLSRHRLGHDPEAVARRLSSARPAGPTTR
jgi:hypothetical protein